MYIGEYVALGFLGFGAIIGIPLGMKWLLKRYVIRRKFLNPRRWTLTRRSFVRDTLWHMGILDQRRRDFITMQERKARAAFAKQWGTHPTLTRREARKIKRQLRRERNERGVR